MAKSLEIVVLDVAGKANVDVALSIYKQANDVAETLGCNVSEVFDAIGYNPAEHIKSITKYSVPQIHRYLGAVSGKMAQIDRGLPILGPDASPEQIEAVYEALKSGKNELEQDLLVSRDMLSEEFAREKYSEAQELLKIISTGNLAIVNDIEKVAKENTKTGGKGKTALYVIITALIAAGAAFSGCLGTSADTTAKEKVQVNQYAGEVTATSTPSNTQVAVADSKIPAWLNIDKDWRDRVVGNLNLPAEGAGLKRTAGGDDKYDDNELVVGDGDPEMMAGIQGDNIVLVVDNDFWNKYDGWAEQWLDKENDATGLTKEQFVEVTPGIYYKKVPIDGNRQMVFQGTPAYNTLEEKKEVPIIAFGPR